jgi:hypothetical protein
MLRKTSLTAVAKNEIINNWLSKRLKGLKTETSTQDHHHWLSQIVIGIYLSTKTADTSCTDRGVLHLLIMWNVNVGKSAELGI